MQLQGVDRKGVSRNLGAQSMMLGLGGKVARPGGFPAQLCQEGSDLRVVNKRDHSHYTGS